MNKCRILKVCGCEKYQMSLDRMRQTHDWFRKPGSFDLTLEKVGCINRANIKSVIMSTVSKTNMKEIPDIIDEVVKAKVNITISSNGDIMACRRGCPAVANGANGNFYGADPQCWNIMKLDNNAHSVFLLHYHLVLVVKYRRQIFDGDISSRAKEIFEYIAPNYNIILEEWNHDKVSEARVFVCLQLAEFRLK